MRFVAGQGAAGDGAKRKSVRKSCRSAGDPARKTMRQHREDAASTKHHREDAANWGTGAEHLRTRVLVFAAAALAFAASGSGQLEATIRRHHKF